MIAINQGGLCEMNKINKKNLKSLCYSLSNKIWILPTMLILFSTEVFAEGSISTAEVNQATENIKNAIIKLAMPIRWDFGICKYCYYSIKNDSKFK